MDPYKRRRTDRLILAASLVAVWTLFMPIDSVLEQEVVTFEMLRDSFFRTDFSLMTKEEKAGFFRDFRQKLLTSENYFRRRFERTTDFAIAYSFLSREEQDLFVDAMMPTQTRRILKRLLAISPEERGLLVDAAFGELPEPARERERVLPEDADRLKRLLCEQSDDEVRQMFLRYFFQQAQEHKKLRYRPLMDGIFRILRDELRLKSIMGKIVDRS